MRFIAGSSRLADDERIHFCQQGIRRRDGSSRVSARRVNSSPFYWQASIFTAAVVTAAMLCGRDGRGAELSPVLEDVPSCLAQASARDELLTNKENEQEAFNAIAF